MGSNQSNASDGDYSRVVDHNPNPNPIDLWKKNYGEEEKRREKERITSIQELVTEAVTMMSQETRRCRRSMTFSVGFSRICGDMVDLGRNYRSYFLEWLITGREGKEALEKEISRQLGVEVPVEKCGAESKQYLKFTFEI